LILPRASRPDAIERYSTYYSNVIGLEGTGEVEAPRDRLLLAAARLLETEGRSFSTRAVCEAAGVTAPTLYHHFGSKDGLIDAVVQFGFSQYVVPPETPVTDPIAALREGWDRHVGFGLDHPTFYVLLYGRVQPGRPCAMTGPATNMLTRLLDAVARTGALRVAPADAAAQILAANVGVTLQLIAYPENRRDRGLSDRVREATLAGVLARPAGHSPRTLAAAAISLRAALADEHATLTPGELALLSELLDRLSA
jgi:AcrR family transcriptional regulator